MILLLVNEKWVQLVALQMNGIMPAMIQATPPITKNTSKGILLWHLQE